MRATPSPRSLSTLVVTLLVAILSIQATAASQESSGDWSAWTGTPDPAECTVEPITAEAFVRALASAVATPQTDSIPTEVASIDDLPGGEPASAEETGGALATVREVLACVNAGSLSSALALFTPGAIAQLLFGTAGVAGEQAVMTEEEIAESVAFFTPFLETPATPVAADQWATLDEIREVRRLADGRILVVSVGSASIADGVAFAILVKEGDRWLIDAAGSIGTPGTPAPSP